MESSSAAQSAQEARCSFAAAGASLFVAGSAVFGADDPAAAYQAIAQAAGAS